VKIDQYLTIISTVLLAFLGWWAGYPSTVRRDRIAKRRDLRTQYLIEAYRRLESSANREKPRPEREKIESAIADIQLFGSPGQVAMARRFAAQFVEERGASMDDLLESLRVDLRKELDLGPTPDRIVFLRITDGG